MRLQSARDLKQELLGSLIEPVATRSARVRSAGAQAFAATLDGMDLSADAAFAGMGARSTDSVPEVQRSLALGVSPHGQDYRLAIRLQRVALRNGAMVERLTRRAKGEVDVRVIGRVDKRPVRKRLTTRGTAKAASATLWYRDIARPLLIGVSVGHRKVTAGTLGAFAAQGSAVCLLSNNHVLANENNARLRDSILQPGTFDEGKHPKNQVARLRQFVPLRRPRANLVDAALAELMDSTGVDFGRLRAIDRGRDRRLKGLGPEFVDEGEIVFKIGRTTGPTRGRITAFDLDNVVVSYDIGNIRFDNQIEIEGAGSGPFSDGGDSGSLIVNADMEAVGLLFAGSDTGGTNGAGLTFANPIHRVLDDLRATLLF